MKITINGKEVSFKDEMLMEDLFAVSFPPTAAMSWLQDQKKGENADFSDPRAQELLRYLVKFLTKMNTSGIDFMKQPVNLVINLLLGNSQNVMEYLGKMLGSFSGELPKQ